MNKNNVVKIEGSKMIAKNIKIISWYEMGHTSDQSRIIFKNLGVMMTYG